jgi:hypothetical protein
MRKAVGVVMAVLVLVAGCGGDDGEETREVELEPIAAVEACDLLDASRASELAGADVEAAAASAEDPNVCEFAFAEGEGEGVGSGIAASLRLEEGDESDVPGGSLARALRLGDAGAVETTETAVKVVYVVREIVVRIEVTPADGVDDAAVERVVEFAEETEAPVVEAVTGEAPAEEASTTTTEASTTTTEETATSAPDADVDALWSRTAVEHREAIGEQFTYDCPPGGTPRTIWGDHTTGYTDDSSVCTAAVHAGEITIDEGGEVLIQMVPGQPSYPSTEANGITSQEWPEWPAGFLVLGAD